MSSYLLTRRGPITTLPLPGESKSQYVPMPIQLPSGDIWFVVKGDESRSIHAYKSTDSGATFAYQGIVIAPSGGSNWDGGMCLDPVMTYDAATATIHYLWKGKTDPNGGYGGFSIGHGTAPGANPMALTRDPLNPILTPAIVQAFFPWTGTLGDLYASDAMRDPWGVLLIWCGFRDASGIYHIFRTRGGWNSFTPRVEGQVHPTAPWSHVQAPCVFQHPDYPVSLDAQGNGVGRYVLIFTEGHDSGAVGALHQMSAWCLADGNWNWQRTGNLFLPSGPAGAWDAKLAYAAHLLKGGARYDVPIVVDGKQLLFYSGAPTTSFTARSGIADLVVGAPVETAVIG